MNQAICTKCRKFVDYTVKEVDDVWQIKGEDIHYKKKLAFCKECGEEVWVAELDDYNAEAPWEIYRKKHNINAYDMYEQKVWEEFNKYNAATIDEDAVTEFVEKRGK